MAELSVPLRPPTPPKSSAREGPSSFSRDSASPREAEARNHATSNMPADLTPSSGNGNGSKKVNFSPVPPLVISASSRLEAPSRRSAATAGKPGKSILKASSAPSDVSLLDLQQDAQEQEPEPTSAAAMLRSVLYQLANDDQSSRSDAYMALYNSWKMYADLPDDQSLVESVPALARFIRRDICMPPEKAEPQNLKLARQALKLLIVFLWKPEFAAQLSDEYKIFVLDHTIASIQKATTKAVTVDYLNVLSTQNFQSKLMGNGRAVQILTTLKDLTDRVDGKAIIAGRIAIYERLLTQARLAISSRADLWMDQFIIGLFHAVKEVRVRAMAFGFQAASVLGPSATVSNALREVFDIPLGDGTKFMSRLSGRLNNMVSTKGEAGADVPDIWSIVILLLRANKWSVDQWPSFRSWLEVFQGCFNSSDATIKSHALRAWDRLVCSLLPSNSLGRDTLKILRRPIVSQFERKGDKQNSLVIQAFQSYCNLLYNAFCPFSAHERFDLYWEEYVSRPFVDLPNDAVSNVRAFRILSSLFWNPQAKVWEEDKVSKVDTFEPEDLPSLDRKWIRSRLSIILPVFEGLFQRRCWDPPLDRAPVGISWINLCKALNDASRLEVTPSLESTQALASILGMLHRLWKVTPGSLNAPTDDAGAIFYERFSFLCDALLRYIQPGLLMEKPLLKTSRETFQTVNTPTHRLVPDKATVRLPILHLFTLVSLAPISHHSPGYLGLVDKIIEAAVSFRSSKSARLEILRQFLLQIDELSENSPIYLFDLQGVWQSIAQHTVNCLGAPMGQDINDHAFDDDTVERIILSGMAMPAANSTWAELLKSAAPRVQFERGELGLERIIERVSERLPCQPLAMSMKYLPSVFRIAVIPRNWNSASRSNVPFHTHAPSPKIKIPHEEFILVAQESLGSAYKEMNDIDSASLAGLLEAAGGFLNRCPSLFLPVAFQKLQPGLSPWVADPDQKLTPDIDKALLDSAHSLATSSLKLLESTLSSNLELLEQLSPLLVSGFRSCHEVVVNNAILLWNNVYGKEQTVDYPEGVAEALNTLKPFVHLELPSFPFDSEPAENPPNVLTTVEPDLSMLSSPMKTWHRQLRGRTSLSSALGNSSPSDTNKERRKKKSPKRDSSPVSTPSYRPRHDDSQVEFVPVDSSTHEDPESQVLTENQKEVCHRQKSEAANTFAGLRSPFPHLSQFAPDGLPNPRPDVILGTPCLDRHLANDDEQPASSPTPGSKVQTSDANVRTSQELVLSDSRASYPPGQTNLRSGKRRDSSGARDPSQSRKRSTRLSHRRGDIDQQEPDDASIQVENTAMEEEASIASRRKRKPRKSYNMEIPMAKDTVDEHDNDKRIEDSFANATPSEEAAVTTSSKRSTKRRSLTFNAAAATEDATDEPGQYERMNSVEDTAVPEEEPVAHDGKRKSKRKSSNSRASAVAENAAGKRDKYEGISYALEHTTIPKEPVANADSERKSRSRSSFPRTPTATTDGSVVKQNRNGRVVDSFDNIEREEPMTNENKPKKRGRPSKHNKPLNSAQDSVDESSLDQRLEDATAREEAPVSNTTKRKRGRPSKQTNAVVSKENPVEWDQHETTPSSPGDELQQQIQSQLELDLEHSMDVDHEVDHGPTTRSKRKREDIEPALSGWPSKKKQPFISATDAEASTDHPRRHRNKSKSLPAVTTRQTRSSNVELDTQIEVPGSDPAAAADTTQTHNMRRRRSTRLGATDSKDASQSQDQSQKTEGQASGLSEAPSLIPETVASGNGESGVVDEMGEGSRAGSQQDMPNNWAEGTDSQRERTEAQLMEPNTEDIQHDTDDIHEEATESVSLPPTEQSQLQEEQPSSPVRGILSSLRDILSSIKSLTLDRHGLRRIDDAVFDVKVAAHDAARRHEEV